MELSININVSYYIYVRKYLIYYIDMSIIDYKRKMIVPLWELERRKKINFEIVYNNKIISNYKDLIKLYVEILRWR